MALREERVNIATDRVIASKNLPIPLLVTQDKNNLCWAGCTTSILSYYGMLNGDKLCDVVMKMKDLTSCCPSPPASGEAAWTVKGSCNKTIKTNEVEQKWRDKFHLGSEYLPGKLESAQVFDEIQNHRRPIMIKVDTLQETKHVILIFGWQEGGINPISGSAYNFYIFNPANGARVYVSYDYLVTKWQATWWKLPEGPPV